jgi:hypothetical protein
LRDPSPWIEITMTRIRVEPNKLRQTAQRLEAIADRLRSLGREALGITLNAPSYEGQFGPKARTMGLEAEARLVTQADRTSALCEELIAKAEAFEAADQRSLAALHQLGESMGEWMEQAAPILASLAMASAFPWQLVQRHLRLGSLINADGPSLGPLGPPPIGPDPPEGIPLRVWYHLPRDDQLAILMEIAAEGKSDPTAWVPLVRPPFINAEAWARIPLDDQRAILLEIGEWPAIFGVTVGSTRYVRANLDALNRVWTYDEDGNIVETDMSYFDVDALSGEIWVEYDFEEVTRSISEEELLNESEQSVAVRLIISEVGADRVANNANSLWEGVGICWTIDNRITAALENPDGLIPRPLFGGTRRGEAGDFISVATSGTQYRGIKKSLGLKPTEKYDQEMLMEATDIAITAHKLFESGLIEDITHGSIKTEIGATSYVHRCGPPGTEAYGEFTGFCDTDLRTGIDPPPKDITGEGITPEGRHQGPLVFKGFSGRIDPETGTHLLIETGVKIDYVPLE